VRVLVHLLGGRVVRVGVLVGLAVVLVDVAVLDVLVVVTRVLMGVHDLVVDVLVGVDRAHGTCSSPDRTVTDGRPQLRP
jgi:hypothetical protein